MISRPLKQNAIKELIRAICVPLAVTNLYTPVSGLVTASDASEAGGGLCGTGGLSEEGRQSLMQAEGDRSREEVSFRQAGSTSFERQQGLGHFTFRRDRGDDGVAYPFEMSHHWVCLL